MSIEFMDKEKIEQCLTLVMMDNTFFTCDYKFATIDVWFSLVEKAQELSDKTLKTEHVVLLPTYMGCHTSRVNTAWMMAALCRSREDKINIMQICMYAAQLEGKNPGGGNPDRPGSSQRTSR